MDNKRKIRRGKTFITVTVVLTAVCMLVLLAVLFQYVYYYRLFEFGRDDLYFDEFIFERYEENEAESVIKHELYFKGETQPFVIYDPSNCTDVNALAELKSGDVLEVYYYFDIVDDKPITIYDIRSSEGVILSFNDVKAESQKPLLKVIIFAFVDMVFEIAILIFFSKVLAFKNPETNLGKVKMEYASDGNVISVYNSPYVFSLVINDEVVCQHWGMISFKPYLKGEIEQNGEKILVEVKMNSLTGVISLSLNGVVVSKTGMNLAG